MTFRFTRSTTSRAALAALAIVGAPMLMSACAPLIVGGAIVGSAMMVVDRRTSGVQIEDQAIELKSANRARDVVGERGHVSVTSYNRLVLITGEVPTEADRAAVEQQVAKVENVRSIVNELAVMGPTSLTARSNDTIITSKVKATLVDAKDVQASVYKVLTERGTVYLMGRVTEREANRGADLARSVNGVQKVVKVFETITEEELAAMKPAEPPKK
jgi:osmotically-inducible protein OsmY